MLRIIRKTKGRFLAGVAAIEIVLILYQAADLVFATATTVI